MARLRTLWEEQRGLCWYCERYVPSRGATRDHVVPRSRGGQTTYENLVMACRRCNSDKADKPTQRTKTPERLARLAAKGPLAVTDDGIRMFSIRDGRTLAQRLAARQKELRREGQPRRQ
jgi:5-methylcytosine-specific restriction endonuclease McrA